LAALVNIEFNELKGTDMAELIPEGFTTNEVFSFQQISHQVW
jgi:hypothetical protein